MNFVIEFKPRGNELGLRPSLNALEAETLAIAVRRTQEALQSNNEGIDEAVIYVPVRVLKASRSVQIVDLHGKTVPASMPASDADLDPDRKGTDQPLQRGGMANV